MSSNNNTSPEAIVFIFVIAIVILILKVIAWIVFLGAIAVTGYSTVIALACWKTPRVIHGELVTPEEAQGFILRGIIGGFVFFLLSRFYCIWEHTHLSENVTALIVFIGYAFGSIGIGMALEEQKKAEAAQPPVEILPPAPPPVERPPFHFASWDDEDLQ